MGLCIYVPYFSDSWIDLHKYIEIFNDGLKNITCFGNSFKVQVRSVTTEIFDLGQTQRNLRKDEQEQFMVCIQRARSQSQKKSQE